MTPQSQAYHRRQARKHQSTAGHYRMAAELADKPEDRRIHEAKAQAHEHQGISSSLLGEAEKRDHQQRIHAAKAEELRELANGMNDQQANQRHHAQADHHQLQADNHQKAADNRRDQAGQHDLIAHDLWREVGRREGK